LEFSSIGPASHDAGCSVASLISQLSFDAQTRQQNSPHSEKISTQIPVRNPVVGIGETLRFDRRGTVIATPAIAVPNVGIAPCGRIPGHTSL
jgi:hypothetical protein